MAEPRERDERSDEAARREEERERGTMDPGLKEQFERGHPVVRMHPSHTADADALQRPHYEPDDDAPRAD
jgi:hypothetical protein